MKPDTQRGAQFGFTLIELVVTMAIIAILAAIAIPSYTAYIMRSHRSDARGQLLEVATWMERWRTERGRYDNPASPGNPPPSPPFPVTYTQSPPPDRHGTTSWWQRRPQSDTQSLQPRPAS